MNWSRGLFRAWILFSTLWVFATGIVTFNVATNLPLDPTKCRSIETGADKIARCEAAQAAGLEYHPKKVRFFVGLMLIPPILLFAVGYAGIWAARGFTRSN